MKKNNWYFFALAAIFVLYIGMWFASAQVLAGAYHNAGQLSVSNQLIQASGGDSGEYVALASSLLHGQFALPGEAFEYFRTPGYPAFVAAIEFLHGSYLTVTLLQILLAFATALMIWAVGAKFLGKAIGNYASILFLLNPLVLLMSLQVMTDMVFTFLLFLGIAIILFSGDENASNWKYSKIISVILAALIFAASTYVRPAGLVALPLFIAPIIATSISLTRKFWYSVLLAAIFALALLPWMIRNYDHSHVFSFSSLAAYNLTAYNVPMFEATLHGDSDVAERVSIETTLGIPLTQWRNLSTSASLEKYDKTMILHDPLRYVAYHLFESTGFFVNSGLQPLLSYMSEPFHYTAPATSKLNLKELLVHGQFGLFIVTVTSPWWLFVERLFLGLGFILAIFGLYMRRRSPLAWLAAFIIVYFSTLSGPVAEARYRLPAAPFFELLIAAGFFALWSLVVSRMQHSKLR